MTIVRADAVAKHKPPADGWGIEYKKDAISVGIYIKDTRGFKEPELPDLVAKDIASAANVSFLARIGCFRLRHVYGGVLALAI